MKYTLPLVAKGESGTNSEVLSIVHDGGEGGGLEPPRLSAHDPKSGSLSLPLFVNVRA